MTAFDARDKKGSGGANDRSGGNPGDSFNREDSRGADRGIREGRENYGNREGSQSRGNRDSAGDSRPSAFAKDKRPRVSRSVPAGKERDAGEVPRRSFNPNFTKDNRLRDNDGNRERPSGDRDWNREFRPREDFGNRSGDYDRPRTYGDKPRPYGEKPWNKEGGNRPSGDRDWNRESRPPRDNDFNRSGGYDRPRPYGDKPRPYGDKPWNKEGGNRERPYGDKPRPYGDKPWNKEGGNRPSGDRDWNRESRPPRDNDGNRSGGYDRPRSYGDKPRPYGDKPWNKESRPGGSGYDRPRPYGDKPRPYGDKPRPYGDKSWNKEGNRPGGGSGYDRPRPGGGKGPGAKREAFKKYSRDEYPRFEAPKATGAVRLNRYIANSGVCSRREADEFIQAGVVMVNGVVANELGTKVMPSDEVRFNNEVIKGEKKVYIVMNKPKGFVTSLEDPHADRTVMDILGDACSERVYPIGRLDKNSVGVLLITNDGELTRQLTHPAYKKKKIYQVSLDKPLTKADMEQIAAGIELEDGVVFADEISYVDDNKREIGIEIHSGRNRIVRRIFESLGYSVQKLDRVYFAGLTKKSLKRGAWRFLSPREVGMLKGGEYE